MSACRRLGLAFTIVLVATASAWQHRADHASAGPSSAIATGGGHSCAIASPAGRLTCWGENDDGQLGDGTTVTRGLPRDVVGLSSGVLAVTAGLAHTCARTSGSGVKCWGDNAGGELGDGTTIGRSLPVDVSGLAMGVTAVAAGTGHTCALTTAGGVKCWGDNAYGELGDGTTVNRSAPVDVTGLTSGVSAIATGSFFTCAITTAGGVKCWGDNAYGQLGDGTTTRRSEPVDVTGLPSSIASIGAGTGHACAVTHVGALKCWGNNEFGQLGERRACQTPCTMPVAVEGLTSGTVAVVGGYFHTCALTTAGAVKCWGNNQYGQVGDGHVCGNLCAHPENVVGLASGVAAIATGPDHACALTSARGVLCWGNNYHGQLGDNGACLTPCDEPVEVHASIGGQPGDVNCDGSVSAIDAALLLQFDAGLVASLSCAENGDTNGDGHSNSLDAALVLQYSAGLITHLPP